MALNKKDRKERKKLIKEAHEIYEFRNKPGFFQTYFDLHYEDVMKKIRDLDVKSLRDSLSKTNPLYKCSK